MKVKIISIWLFVFIIIISGYAFRFELSDVKNRILAVLLPSRSWTNNNGSIVIARSNDGHFYLEAIIGDTSINFMIDTGASDVLIAKNDAIKLGLDLATLNFSKKYNTANGVAFCAPVTINDFHMHHAVFNDIKASISQSSDDTSLLGMSLISKFKSFSIDRDLLKIEF